MSAQCPVCGAASVDSLLCHSCCEALERELGDVAAIVAELDVTLSRQARVGSGGKGGLASEKNPVHLGAMQAHDDLANTLTTWAKDINPKPWGLQSYGQPTCVAARMLLGHIDAIRRHAAVEELVDEVTDAIRNARRAVDRPVDRQYLGTCLVETPDEEGNGITCYEEIWARQGAREAVCKVCGITHDVTERRAWLLTQAKDVIATVKEASRYLGEIGDIRITEASIRGYVHRGKIAYRAPVEAKRIRLGDLLEVVLDEGERKSA